MSTRTAAFLLAAEIACLAATPGAAAVPAQTGHMAMQAPEREPGLCRLLSSRPVVVPARTAMAELPAARSPYLRLTDDARRHELVIDVGPVDVPARAMAEHSTELVYQLTYFPLDAWVHGYRVELTDARGRPVPRRVLHHIDTTRPDAHDLFLPVAQRFVALGSETGPENLPAWLAGVPIHEGEPLLVSTMLHNPTDTTYSGVRVRLVLAYTRSRPLLEVAGFRLDVMFPTGPMEFDLPPGRTVRSWDGSPAVPARILGISGHLHRYAEWIELRDLTTNRVIWRARPRTDEAHDVTSMPVTFPRFGLGVTVSATHRYRISASYFNPTGRTIRHGAMAKLGGIFTPIEPLPPVDVRDALYQEDLRYLLGLRCAADGMGEMLAHAVQHGGGD